MYSLIFSFYYIYFINDNFVSLVGFIILSSMNNISITFFCKRALILYVLALMKVQTYLILFSFFRKMSIYNFIAWDIFHEFMIAFMKYNEMKLKKLR